MNSIMGNYPCLPEQNKTSGCIFCNSGVVIYLVNYFYITVIQTDKPTTWEQKFHQYIAPLPRFIIIDVCYNFGNFVIETYTAEFS